MSLVVTTILDTDLMSEEVVEKIKPYPVGDTFYPMPAGFEKWKPYTPVGTEELLLFLVRESTNGKTKQEVLEKLESLPNPINDPESFQQVKRRKTLEPLYQKAGLSYPQNTIELLQLLIRLGLVTELTVDEKTYLPAVLHPYPDPVEFFGESL